MILSESLKRKVRNLSNSSQSKSLYEFLEAVKTHVADIRNEIPCKPEIERDVRIATCDAIEELIIQKIKQAGANSNDIEVDEFI
jgi:hypothetical protein